MSILELMAAPFAECMVLVGIHTYLGIHVLRRRVIFVDLALAQIAALGTMVGFLFGIMPETSAALVVSMIFTFFGAAVFALSRGRIGHRPPRASRDEKVGKRGMPERIPQEAVIGLVYAITAATAVLVVEKTQGAEHLKDILVGSILWVKWSDVGLAAVAYAVIGALHFIFRRQFLLISENPEEAARQGLTIRAWDFFFYVTFGFVITFSTRVAGVLLVFVFLVAPAIMAFLVTSRLLHQLLIGWGMGTVVTLLGLLLSYVFDLPSGPSVVAFYGIALTLGALVFYIIRAPSTRRAVAWVGTGVVGTAAAAGLFYLGATLLAGTSLALDRDHLRVATETTRANAERRAHTAAASETALSRPLTVGNLKLKACQRYLALPDAETRLELITEILGRCQRGGLKLIVVFLADPSTPEFFRSEAIELLRRSTGQDFGFSAEATPDGAANTAALEKLQRHVEQLPPGAKEVKGSPCEC